MGGPVHRHRRQAEEAPQDHGASAPGGATKAIDRAVTEARAAGLIRERNNRTGFLNEADGIRTRNHRIDSVVIGPPHSLQTHSRYQERGPPRTSYNPTHTMLRRVVA